MKVCKSLLLRTRVDRYVLVQHAASSYRGSFHSFILFYWTTVSHRSVPLPDPARMPPPLPKEEEPEAYGSDGMERRVRNPIHLGANCDVNVSCGAPLSSIAYPIVSHIDFPFSHFLFRYVI